MKCNISFGHKSEMPNLPVAGENNHFYTHKTRPQWSRVETSEQVFKNDCLITKEDEREVLTCGLWRSMTSRVHTPMETHRLKLDNAALHHQVRHLHHLVESIRSILVDRLPWIRWASGPLAFARFKHTTWELLLSMWWITSGWRVGYNYDFIFRWPSY